MIPWVALVVRPRAEKKIEAGLANAGLETFVPWHGVRRRWSDRIKILEQNLFPGYIFCRSSFEERVLVMRQPGVNSVVSFDHAPALIPDDQIAALRAAVNSGLPLGPWPFLKAGQRVRIEHGVHGWNRRHARARFRGMAHRRERRSAAKIRRRRSRPRHDSSCSELEPLIKPVGNQSESTRLTTVRRRDRTLVFRLSQDEYESLLTPHRKAEAAACPILFAPRSWPRSRVAPTTSPRPRAYANWSAACAVWKPPTSASKACSRSML